MLKTSILDGPQFDYVNNGNPTIDVNPKRLYATWMNITSGELFICTDSTVDKNIWGGQLGTIIRPSISGLIHRYLLQNDAKDSVGSSDGTVYGTIYFNGYYAATAYTTGSRIQLTDSAWGLTTNYTICFWTILFNFYDGPVYHTTNASWGNTFQWWFDSNGNTGTFQATRFKPIFCYATPTLGLNFTDDGINSYDDGYFNHDFTNDTQVNLFTDVDSSPSYNNPVHACVADLQVYDRELSIEELSSIQELPPIGFKM